ncbi:hypothetical protein IAR50_000886 [Cryptococcus sp. DSM 104548]
MSSDDVWQYALQPEDGPMSEEGDTQVMSADETSEDDSDSSGSREVEVEGVNCRNPYAELDSLVEREDLPTDTAAGDEVDIEAIATCLTEATMIQFDDLPFIERAQMAQLRVRAHVNSLPGYTFVSSLIISPDDGYYGEIQAAEEDDDATIVSSVTSEASPATIWMD